MILQFSPALVGRFKLSPQAAPAEFEMPSPEIENPQCSPRAAGASRVWSSGSGRVQAINVRRVGQLALPLLVVRDRGGDERRADLLNHLILRTLNHCNVPERMFGVGDLCVGRLAIDHPRAKLGASFFLDQPRTKLRRHVFGPALFALFLDRSVNSLGHSWFSNHGSNPNL